MQRTEQSVGIIVGAFDPNIIYCYNIFSILTRQVIAYIKYDDMSQIVKLCNFFVIIAYFWKTHNDYSFTIHSPLMHHSPACTL